MLSSDGIRKRRETELGNATRWEPAPDWLYWSVPSYASGTARLGILPPLEIAGADDPVSGVRS